MRYKKRSKKSSIVKGASIIGLGFVTILQPEIAIVTLPLILAIGKGK